MLRLVERLRQLLSLEEINPGVVPGEICRRWGQHLYHARGVLL